MVLHADQWVFAENVTAQRTACGAKLGTQWF